MEGRCRKTAFVLKKNQGRFCPTEMAIKIWPHLFLKTKRPLPEPTSRGAYIRQPFQAHESLLSA
jgi:hypothetical protein